MKAKFKFLYYYLAELFLTILILCLFLLIVLKTTILSPNYILKSFEKNNYYENLTNSIETEMTYYVDQSGLEDEVVIGIVNKEIVKTDIEEIIKNLYSGSKTTIKTDYLKNKLEKSIDEYLEKHNLTTKEEDINLFIEEMEDIYINKTSFNNNLNSFTNILVKINKIILVSIVVLFFTILIFFFITKIICRKYVLSVPCMTAALLVFLGNYLLFSKIDVEHIKLWNDNVSITIRSIISNVSIQTIIGAVILIVLSLLFTCIKVFRKRKK